MKRRNLRRSSPVKKIARTDVVPNALDRFRNALSSPEEFSNENEMLHATELEKKKVIEEFMPIILKSKSSAQEVYNMVLKLETGIQLVIEDYLKTFVPQDESVNALQGQDQRYGSDMEEENVNLHTVVKTENDDLTITHEWASTHSPEPGTWVPQDASVNVLQDKDQRKGSDVEEESGECQEHGSSSSMEEELPEGPGPEIVTAAGSTSNNLNPSTSTSNEMQLKLGSDKDATVKLSQLPKDVHHVSGLEDKLQQVEPVIATDTSASPEPEHEDNMEDRSCIEHHIEPEASSSLVEVKEGPQIVAVWTNLEMKKFKELESFILWGLTDIRYCWYLQSVKSNIEKLKRLLKRNEDFCNDEYRQIHGRLVRAVKIAGKVLLNARVSYASGGTESDRPVYIVREDDRLWTLTLDVDIRECLPSQRNLPEFKQDKAYCERRIFETLRGFGLIKDEEVSSYRGKVTPARRNPGRVFQDFIQSQAPSKERRSSYLFMEVLYYIWKIRAKPYNWPWNWKDLDHSDDDEDKE